MKDPFIPPAPARDLLLTRREALACAAKLGVVVASGHWLPAYADAGAKATQATKVTPAQEAIDLSIRKIAFDVEGKIGNGISVNGTIPGPLIRLRQGDEAKIRVTNTLSEITSIHWHGLLVPPGMDGVPGVSFAGVKPQEIFTYRFPVEQSGTYWYHSHSGGQELLGVYGPIIIDPVTPDPFRYDRDYVVLLSDWSFSDPMTIIGKLKSDAGYYNFQKRTAGDFFSDISKLGVFGTLSDRLQWAGMRMDPTDISDVTGYTYTYLMNGLAPSSNWNAIFRKGERIRLRFIDAAAMTLFDIRIPGLKMTVVQADGQNIKPVLVDEFRIGPGETYDVIVEPTEEKAYPIFAETIDRSGYALGTLGTRAGMHAPIPERRKRSVRGMADMGMPMSDMKMKESGGMKGMDMPDSSPKSDDSKMKDMPGMKMPEAQKMEGHTISSRATSPIPGLTPVKHGPDHHGPGNSFVPEESRNRLAEPGIGLENTDTRVLVYTDLRRLSPNEDTRVPSREIELHLTGNMTRYSWSIDGKKYSEAPAPIPFRYGERLRLTLVNDTMMEHPMHLHGMWMYLENGTGNYLPRKHTIIVKPAERMSVLITADAKGQWAFHCHLLLHMEMGMFRVIEVSDKGAGTS